MSTCTPVSSRKLMTAGAGLIAVTYGLIRFGYGLYLPTFTADFALSSAVAGGIASGSFGGYCAAALIAQRLITFGQPRLTLWVACGLAVFGSLTVATAQSATSLGVGVVLAGSAAGAASPALVVAVRATVAADVHDRCQAVVNSGTGVGVVAGGLLFAAMSGQWRGVWVGFALASLLATAAVDRQSAWPTAMVVPPSDAVGRPRENLLRPAVLAAVSAGAGSAAVWTFGTELLTTTGGLPPSTTAVLWCLLGGAGVLGALSGDLVRACGLRLAWTITATVMSLATVVLAWQPSIAVAATALAAFGGAYIALSGVLIGWATHAVPQRAAEATATLFIALTAGQALGAFTLGVIAESTTLPAAFLIAAGLLLGSLATMRRPAGHLQLGDDGVGLDLDE